MLTKHTCNIFIKKKKNAYIHTYSLTLPKLCMHGYPRNKEYVHYICGRFVPNTVIKSFNLKLPQYGFNTNQIAKFHYV